VIYPQVVLVSAKKKPWMFEIFSINLGYLFPVPIKSIFLGIPTYNERLLAQMGPEGK
jgi:hypothetical protein